MHYKQLLWIIDAKSQNDSEFDARSLSQYIAEQFPTIINPPPRTKLISNDLNRLYRMQLLSRRKVKRPVGGGDFEYRGFMYVYWLNKQGRSYVNYLKRTALLPGFQDYLKKFELRTKFHSAYAISNIEKALGDKIDDLDETYAEYLYQYSKPKTGRSARFLPRISFEFVKELMERKHKLEEENKALKDQLDAARSELRYFGRRTLF